VISSVSPDCDSASTTSSPRRAPRSPCIASAGWRKWLGVPVEASVAEIFRATSPGLADPGHDDVPTPRSMSRTAQAEQLVEQLGGLQDRSSFSAGEISRPRTSTSASVAAGERGRSSMEAGTIGRLGNPPQCGFQP